MAVFVYFGHYIAKTLFSNSEKKRKKVAPWSRFYGCKYILCTKQPFADIFKIGLLKI